jgi:hypothetical protein
MICLKRRTQAALQATTVKTSPTIAEFDRLRFASRLRAQ